MNNTGSRKSISKLAMSAFLVTPMLLTWKSALAENGGMEGQVRQLIRQNQMLKKRLNRVEDELTQIRREEELSETVTVGEEAVGGGENGFLSELDNRISFSGLIEFGGAWQEVEKKSGEHENSSNLAMTTVELAVEAEVNSWLSLETVLLYEDPIFDDAESSLDLDVAALTLANPEKCPFYLSVGKMYVPFGALLTHMPDDPLLDSPLTLAMGETGEKAALLGFEARGFTISGYTFNGDVEEAGEEDQIDGYGFDANYSVSLPISFAERIRKGEKYPHGKATEMDLLVGASYISNIAESDGLTEVIGEEVGDYVAGYAAYLHTGLHGLFLDAEYMSAADHFAAAELAAEGRGARPSVWNLELGFNYDWGKDLEVVFNYAGSDEAGDLGFPEKRYGLNFNREIFSGTVASLGYLRDYYERDDAEDRDRRDLVFSQIAVEF